MDKEVHIIIQRILEILKHYVYNIFVYFVILWYG